MPNFAPSSRRSAVSHGVDGAAVRKCSLRSPRPAPLPEPPVVRDLTARASRGDAEALGSLYEFWFEESLATARALTRRDDAFCLDAVQDAWIRVARSVRRMDTPDDFSRWLFRLVACAAKDLLRRERRRRGRELAAAGRSPDGPFSHDRDWLRAALRTLSVRERALIEARFGRGLSLDETGRASGLTGGAAHGQLRRALERLRRLARGELHD